MRIHTDATEAQLFAIARGQSYGFHALTEHGSRTHARSFEVRLEGSGGRNNTGMYGAGDFNGATWDEWGAFLGQVFALDPTARMGGTVNRPVYADAEDFHFQTGGRFRDGMPADPHPRHQWQYTGTGHVCSKCTATRPAGDFRREVSA